MRNILIIIGFIIAICLIGCGYSTICPAPELAGVWKYTDVDNQGNNMIFSFTAFDNYCEITEEATYEYIYSLNKNKTKITLKRANSYGGTFKTVKRIYGIKIKKNYFILTGMGEDKKFVKIKESAL